MSMIHRLQDIAYKAHFAMSEGEVDMVTLVWVAADMSDAEDLIELLKRKRSQKMPKKIRNLVGVVLGDDSDGLEFVPLSEFSFHEAEAQEDFFVDNRDE